MFGSAKQSEQKLQELLQEKQKYLYTPPPLFAVADNTLCVVLCCAVLLPNTHRRIEELNDELERLEADHKQLKEEKQNTSDSSDQSQQQQQLDAAAVSAALGAAQSELERLSRELESAKDAVVVKNKMLDDQNETITALKTERNRLQHEVTPLTHSLHSLHSQSLTAYSNPISMLMRLHCALCIGG